ncbi:hypothetical protein GCM10010271_45480 [Streptomyces kurssanovii]|nr:hypothetical protein GCM10010271_45480 [Streptomyces kurssanovii]
MRLVPSKRVVGVTAHNATCESLPGDDAAMFGKAVADPEPRIENKSRPPRLAIPRAPASSGGARAAATTQNADIQERVTELSTISRQPAPAVIA